MDFTDKHGLKICNWENGNLGTLGPGTERKIGLEDYEILQSGALDAGEICTAQSTP